MLDRDNFAMDGEEDRGEGGANSSGEGDGKDGGEDDGEDEGDGEGEGEGNSKSVGEGDGRDQDSGESDSQIEIPAGRKCKASTSKSNGKTSAHPLTSTQAKAGTPQLKKLKGAVVFKEVLKSEEKTWQKELEVQAEKWRYNTQKVKAKAEHEHLKVEVLHLKLEDCRECTKAKLEAEMKTCSTASLVPYDPLPLSFASGSGSESQTPSTIFDGEVFGFASLLGEAP